MFIAAATSPLAQQSERVPFYDDLSGQPRERGEMESASVRRVRAPIGVVGEGVAPPETGAPPKSDGVSPQRAPGTEEAAPGERAPPGGGARRDQPFEGIRREEELSPEERKMIEELKARDREVRAHEAAHKVAGGQHVRGGASYTYQSGPDGSRYAIGGEVSIDVSPVKGDPEATLRKAETIRRAALAPAEPSPADMAIAAKAAQMAAQARMEIAAARREGMGGEGGVAPEAGAADGDEGALGRGGTERVPYGALNEFAATARAGRSSNLLVNVYA